LVEVDWEGVGRKNIGRAVVKPIVAIQGERHFKKTIVAIEADKARTAILEAGHGPRREDIAGCKDGLGENYCFGRIGTIKADLPVDGAVCEGQRDETLFRAAVLESDCVVECHCDQERLDVDSVNQEAEIVGEANVGAPVNEGKRFLDPDGRTAIVVKSEDRWTTFDMDNAVGDGGYHQ
jgi:hypothetical protein